MKHYIMDPNGKPSKFWLVLTLIGYAIRAILKLTEPNEGRH